jgi:hypothetical protein
MITAEKLEHHISHLKEQHDLLDKAIKRHYTRYDNDEKVKAEKVKKLALKEEIEKFQNQLTQLLKDSNND